jgi:gluconolactonase
MKKWFSIAIIAVLAGCSNNKQNYPTTGTWEKYDPALDSIISPDAKAEIIADGFDWSEGPLWIEKEKMLLVSDVPTNTIYQWTEEKGKQVYLKPSGYTDSLPRGGEMGSNGLTTDENRSLILTQCGNRQIARMDAPIGQPKASFISLANNYLGKKFNSPNDVVVNSKGTIYFTDPPYGLEFRMDDPKKEMPYQGVFQVKKSGQVVLITDTLTRPNGIAFLPGEKTLLVANSDPMKPNWYAFDVDDNDSVTNGRIFYSNEGYDTTLTGLPDGMKIDRSGNIFAAGPGGLWIFNKTGKLLGKLRLENAASNCSLSGDQKTLYITNDMYVLRLKMR